MKHFKQKFLGFRKGGLKLEIIEFIQAIICYLLVWCTTIFLARETELSVFVLAALHIGLTIGIIIINAYIKQLNFEIFLSSLEEETEEKNIDLSKLSKKEKDELYNLIRIYFT